MKTYLTDWNESDHKVANKGIAKFLKSRRLSINDGIVFTRKTFKQIEDKLGLCYTSSSEYAGLFICNETLYLDEQKKYKLHGFCMCGYGWLYVHCLAIDWNGIGVQPELYIQIS